MLKEAWEHVCVMAKDGIVQEEALHRLYAQNDIIFVLETL